MMFSFPWIDFHTHRVTHSGTVVTEIVSLHPGRWREASVYTVGYHPWWTSQRLSNEELRFLSDQWANETGCLAIGECGLDRLKGPQFEIQEEIFYQHIRLSEELQAPLIIHCVRAFDKLIELRRTGGFSDWVVHGFVRNKILAKQLLDHGIFLSVAPHHKISPTMKEMLQFLPLDRIFIESDSDQSLSIIERYRIFASLRDLSPEKLQEQLFHNTINFFHKKWPHHIG